MRVSRVVQPGLRTPPPFVSLTALAALSALLDPTGCHRLPGFWRIQCISRPESGRDPCHADCNVKERIPHDRPAIATPDGSVRGGLSNGVTGFQNLTYNLRRLMTGAIAAE